jgi:predicted lipid carrier protein YhbT
MTDATAKFFGDLGQRGDDPRLRKATGTLRFDIVHNDEIEHWMVAADHGDVKVSHPDGPEDSDCVVRTDKALFEGITRGEENATAAMLRGALWVEGDLELLWLFQRLLTGAPTASEAREASAGRSAPR